VGASTERRFIEKCYVLCTHIEISFYRLCCRFVQASSWNITKRCSDCWIYRDTSVKMRFRAAHLIATKFTSIKSPTQVTVKIYCRAKRRVSSHLAARMILLIIIAISVLLIAIIDCIMLSTPPMTRRLTLPEAWPICEAKSIVIAVIPLNMDNNNVNKIALIWWQI